MKQILQDLKSGTISLADVPCPSVQPGHLLIGTSRSLLSSGTERMLLEFGRANLIGKARQQPDKVRQVIDKISTDGLHATLAAVADKLDQPLPVGYCNVGRVLEVGSGVPGFKSGDRVVSNGHHAEVVSVPIRLCAKIPEEVSDDSACFSVLGAIALQGLRLAVPTLGETVAVIGLGLIGLLTVQLLRAQGCRVIGFDIDPKRIDMARAFGATGAYFSQGNDPVSAAMNYSRQRGVDAVLITAATKSNEPVRQAARMCRKRGRIVLVGVSGLALERGEFYDKELTFQVSCSYGPGRYDPEYEVKGHDYPIGFVRWTEQRNFEAVLDMLAEQKLCVESLISHRFPINQAKDAYHTLVEPEPSLGILLEYPDLEHKGDQILQRVVEVGQYVGRQREGGVTVSVIGAGQYASRTLIPAFKKANAQFRSISATGGLACTHLAQKYGFVQATSDVRKLLENADTDAIVIATRHDSHAELVVDALKAGKHVFVEKPLCLTEEELDKIDNIYRSLAGSCLLMVGFNRRFAPHVKKIKSLLGAITKPKCFVITVNAGEIPATHWVQDPEVGGGRIVGEACHFVDLMRHLAGAPITNFGRSTLASPTSDTASLALEFSDGSIGTVHYFSNGNRRFPKERLEVFCDGRVLQLDNFRTAKAFAWQGFSGQKLWRQDKGQAACAAAFLEAIVKGAPSPIPYDEIYEVARVSIALAQTR